MFGDAGGKCAITVRIAGARKRKKKKNGVSLPPSTSILGNQKTKKLGKIALGFPTFCSQATPLHPSRPPSLALRAASLSLSLSLSILGAARRGFAAPRRASRVAWIPKYSF